jgi:hypothetical protein
MTTTSKRLTLAAAGTVLLIIVALFTSSGRGGFRAESLVMARSTTNAFFARSFEASVIRASPSIVRLRAVSRRPPAGTTFSTNLVVFLITTAGSSAEDAQRAANEAAIQMRLTVLTNYGIDVFVLQQAKSARSYSVMKDSLGPGIQRLFGD